MEKQNRSKYIAVGIIAALAIFGVFFFNNILFGNSSQIIPKLPEYTLNQNEEPAELIDPSKEFSHLSAEFTASSNEIKETSSGEKYTVDPPRLGEEVRKKEELE